MAEDISSGNTGALRDSATRDKDEERPDAVAHKPLTLLPLVALIFYEVSGGPFGIEDAVVAGGPFLSILGFAVLPLVWSVPEALIAAELATAFPENSGYVAWVTAAFGPFWGFQEGLWSWLSGVSDNAIYPVLFLYYLGDMAESFKQGVYHEITLWASLVVLTYYNYRGLKIVGTAAVVLTVFTLAPFVVFCTVGLFKGLHTDHWGDVNWETVDWPKYANCLFWNINYWDSASTLAGEVQNPKRNFPNGVFLAVFLVFLSYILPLLVALGLDANQNNWAEGYLETLTRTKIGHWLAWWMVCASAVSNIGQFEAEMSSDSFQLQGMAERGMLPAALSKKSKYGTPLIPILLSATAVALQMKFSNSLPELMELLNFMYCLAQLLEFAAFIHLRMYAKDLDRPFKIPLNTLGCVLMLAPPTAFIFAIMWMASPYTWLFAGMTVLCGPLLYYMLEQARTHQWCKFFDLDFQVFPANRSSENTSELENPLLPSDASTVDMNEEDHDIVVVDRDASPATGSYTHLTSAEPIVQKPSL